MNFKKINIGSLIQQKVSESGIEISRICNFLNSNKEDIQKMYEAEKLDTEVLLRWSKLLEYDFFRLYSQHLILYAPASSKQDANHKQNTALPQFRKNIYTKELIDFILEQIEIGDMTTNDVIKKYRIPKTTLHKWINKYKK